MYLVRGVLALGAGTAFPRHMARASGSPCACPLCLEFYSLGTGRTVRPLASHLPAGYLLSSLVRTGIHLIDWGRPARPSAVIGSNSCLSWPFVPLLFPGSLLFLVLPCLLPLFLLSVVSPSPFFRS